MLQGCDADLQRQMPTVFRSACHQCGITPPSEPPVRSSSLHRRRRARVSISFIFCIFINPVRAYWLPRSRRTSVGGSNEHIIQGFVVRPAARSATSADGRHIRSTRCLGLRNWTRPEQAWSEVSMALTTGLEPETAEQPSRYSTTSCPRFSKRVSC